jgi:flagellar FliL protein
MSDKKEEKKEGAPEAAVEGEAKAPANKKKLLIMGGAGLLVVLLGAGGAFFFLSKGSKSASAQNPPETAAEAPSNEHGDGKKEEGKKPEEHGEAKKGDGHGDEKKAEGHGDGSKEKAESSATSSYGQTFALRPFHMNLGNPLENRYLRLEVSLEYKGGDTQKSELDSRTPQIRDIVVSTSSRKTMEFLLGPDGKDQLRYEIFTKLNQVLDKKVEAVYITDILVE